jgi:hypothetical protein
MKMRVKIPVYNPSELLDLAQRVQAKHLAEGDASPLKILDWEEAARIIEEAVTEHEKAQRMRREMRQAFEKRDIKLIGVLNFLRGSRDILAGRYIREMRKLGAWGFDVLDVRRNTTDGVSPGDDTNGVTG